MVEFLLFCFIAWLVYVVAKALKGKPAPSKRAVQERDEDDDDDEIELVGESNYQGALLTLFGPKQQIGIEEECDAVLVAEPTNKYDKNAVRCDIKGRTVGYIPRGATGPVRARMKRSKSNELDCTATVKGGWKTAKSEGSYGVTVRF